MNQKDYEKFVIGQSDRKVGSCFSDKKNKKVLPTLKIDYVESVGEKSPAPSSVYDLFKNYQKTSDTKSASSDNMNVGFDKLSSDEKSRFLRKLQQLTVGNKKSQKITGVSAPCTSDRLLKKFVPLRTPKGTLTGNSSSSSSFNVFGRSPKNFNESESSQQKKKSSARRLNFGKVGDQKHYVNNQDKQVAEMTREYENVSSINDAHASSAVSIKKSYRHLNKAPCGSLESPTDSPSKDASSAVSTPDSSSFNEFLQLRDRSMTLNEQTPNKKRDYSQQSQGCVHRVSNASWHGELPPRDYTSPTFSRKIFVGGVPWDITEAALRDSFGEFGTCAVEWPGQEARYRSGQTNFSPSNGHTRIASKYTGQAATGYVYMIFDDERAVAALLSECSQEIGGAGEWYFKIRAQRSKSTEIRQVQIIPWVTSDSLFCEDDSLLETGIEPKRTVFVGALHGMMTAQVLHSIMEDCFGSVECVQLDTDKFKYPIGSGRVTFRDHGAYFKAIEIGYLHVYTSKFRKRVQIDPFLESTCCMVCDSEPAHCFCRNRDCFKYYCHSCWSVDHGDDNDEDVHIPVIVPSSASKAYSGQLRRTHLTNTSSKLGSIQSPSNSLVGHLLPTGFPMIVGGPPQTLSALYGYLRNNQQMMIPQAVYETPLTPSPNEMSTKRRSFTEFQTPTVFFNSTPVMSPQKNTSCSDGQLPGFFANSAAFLTPPPYYASPGHSSSINNSHGQQQYYGANLYYGYIPSHSSVIRSPQSVHYSQ